MKTSELIGTALDWAVAKCEDRIIRFNLGGGLEARGRNEEGEELPEYWDLWYGWHPSTNWAQGGPIIEREGITLTHQESRWGAQTDDDVFAYGPAPLIAAMRTYVASMLGDEVEVPEELK